MTFPLELAAFDAVREPIVRAVRSGNDAKADDNARIIKLLARKVGIDDATEDDIKDAARNWGTSASHAPLPLNIFREIPAPPIVPSDFPPVLADFGSAIARAAGHDVGAYLMAGLAAAAGAIGDDVRILLDSRSSWFESARLWVFLLGGPGTAKTPAIRAAMRPLHELHRKLREDHARDTASLPADAEKPPMPTVFINDATIEKLSEILADNPRGIIGVFEELDSWLGAHDCYRGGQGSKDRGEWLRLYDGGPHQVDRIKRGSYFVRNWGASILGATTPASLRSHAKQLPADGLIQRFLPVMVRQPTEPDESILQATAKMAREAYAVRLLELHNTPGGVVRMSGDAAELFRQRRSELREEVQAMGEYSDAFAGHLAKHAAMLGRIALVMHCLERGPRCVETEISGESMQRAAKLLRKLARHSLAMFDALNNGNTSLPLARQLAYSILASELGTVSKNDLIQGCKQFRNADDTEQWRAITVLEDAGWLLPDEGRLYRGKPTAWAVTPSVHETFIEQAERHRQLRRKVLDAFNVDA